jgi:hypothetical protein
MLATAYATTINSALGAALRIVASDASEQWGEEILFSIPGNIGEVQQRPRIVSTSFRRTEGDVIIRLHLDVEDAELRRVIIDFIRVPDEPFSVGCRQIRFQENEKGVVVFALDKGEMHRLRHENSPNADQRAVTAAPS